jgi:hypothetical protein
MFAKCEATQSWLENVTFQMNRVSLNQFSPALIWEAKNVLIAFVFLL